MVQIIELRICILVMLLVVVFLHGTVLGDIPPVPPEFPGTQIELPAVSTIVIPGILLSLAVVLAGVMAGKAGNSFRRKIGLAIGATLLAATVAAAAFAHQQHSEHEKQTKNWRSPGPVEQFSEPPQQEDVDTDQGSDAAAKSLPENR